MLSHFILVPDVLSNENDEFLYLVISLPHLVLVVFSYVQINSLYMTKSISCSYMVSELPQHLSKPAFSINCYLCLLDSWFLRFIVLCARLEKFSV